MTDHAIMIVDDDEVDRYTLKRLIRSSGVEAEIFEMADGVLALEFLRDFEANRDRHGALFPPRLVLLDINMPRMNGFEFLEKFSQLPDPDDRYKPVVFLMVTSSANEADRAKSSEFDCVKGYIKKMPTTPASLREALEPYLPKPS